MRIRPATLDDAEIVLDWRNDETTRNNSFSKDMIPLDLHRKWFRNKLEDMNCFMYIMEVQNEKVGLIRIDKTNDIGEISYMIAPARRGLGYGKQMIALCENILPEEIRVLMGLVEEHNTPSRKCLCDNGFAEFSGGNICCFIKRIR